MQERVMANSGDSAVYTIGVQEREKRQRIKTAMGFKKTPIAKRGDTVKVTGGIILLLASILGTVAAYAALAVGGGEFGTAVAAALAVVLLSFSVIAVTTAWMFRKTKIWALGLFLALIVAATALRVLVSITLVLVLK